MNIVMQIRKELRSNGSPTHARRASRFFKEPVRSYGVQTPVVRKISQKYYAYVKNIPKQELFTYCEELFRSNYNQEVKIGLDWVYRRKSQLQPSDYSTFERWMKTYITNWGSCDDFCTHAFGHMLFHFPRLITKTQRWTKSKNRWLRRGSAVVLIYGLRREKFLAEALNRATALLEDADDLVQKGYGWMLKEASEIHPKQIYQYVSRNKQTMPRTALRYAIEKLPRSWQVRAMKSPKHHSLSTTAFKA